MKGALNIFSIVMCPVLYRIPYVFFWFPVIFLFSVFLFFCVCVFHYVRFEHFLICLAFLSLHYFLMAFTCFYEFWCRRCGGGAVPPFLFFVYLTVWCVSSVFPLKTWWLA